MEIQTGKFILYVTLLIIGLFFFVVNHSDAKLTIKKYLQKKGAKDIVINREWFDFDRDTLTFSVEFIHPNGKKISARCKINHHAVFLDEEIFWSEPIEIKESKVKER